LAAPCCCLCRAAVAARTRTGCALNRIQLGRFCQGGGGSSLRHACTPGGAGHNIFMLTFSKNAKDDFIMMKKNRVTRPCNMGQAACSHPPWPLIIAVHTPGPASHDPHLGSLGIWRSSGRAR